MEAFNVPVFKFTTVHLQGLDPAAPWFAQTKEEHRMSKEDAKFVDVIHTNSGLLLQVNFRKSLYIYIYIYIY